MAIKKPITSSARWLTSAFCVWGPAVTMVPWPAFACEQLRQPSGVSRTHNRKTLVVLLNRFSLLPSRFREGWGDVQTQCTASSRSSHSDLPPPFHKKKKKSVYGIVILTLMQRVWCIVMMIQFPQDFWAKLKVTSNKSAGKVWFMSKMRRDAKCIPYLIKTLQVVIALWMLLARVCRSRGGCVWHQWQTWVWEQVYFPH